jgi:hypothetical protein
VRIIIWFDIYVSVAIGFRDKLLYYWNKLLIFACFVDVQWHHIAVVLSHLL